jgi:restriction system protein
VVQLGDEMPIPDYQTLMLPLLKHSQNKETRVPEIEPKIADEFGLSQPDRDQMLPSGRQKVIHNRLHWAKFYLSKAGLVESAPQNRFIATDAGRELLSSNPPRIDNQILLQYPSFRNVGIRTSRSIQFKRIDEDFFAEED